MTNQPVPLLSQVTPRGTPFGTPFQPMKTFWNQWVAGRLTPSVPLSQASGTEWDTGTPEGIPTMAQWRRQGGAIMTARPVPEAARALGVSSSTLRRWMRAGALVARRGRRRFGNANAAPDDANPAGGAES